MTRTLAVLLVGLELAAGFAAAQDHILAEASKVEETKASSASTATPADKDFHSRLPRYKLEAGIPSTCRSISIQSLIKLSLCNPMATSVCVASATSR